MSWAMRKFQCGWSSFFFDFCCFGFNSSKLFLFSFSQADCLFGDGLFVCWKCGFAVRHRRTSIGSAVEYFYITNWWLPPSWPMNSSKIFLKRNLFFDCSEQRFSSYTKKGNHVENFHVFFSFYFIFTYFLNEFCCWSECWLFRVFKLTVERIVLNFNHISTCFKSFTHKKSTNRKIYINSGHLHLRPKTKGRTSKCPERPKVFPNF